MDTLKDTNMTANVTFAEKYVLPFLITLFTAITPIMEWFWVVGFFIMADFAAKSLIILRNKPEEWVSGKAWRTAYKLGYALIFISAAYMAEIHIAPTTPVTRVIGSLLIFLELKSLDEKSKEIWGVSVLGFLIDKLTPKK